MVKLVWQSEQLINWAIFFWQDGKHKIQEENVKLNKPLEESHRCLLIKY